MKTLNTKKLICLIAAIAMIVTCFAGCGGSKGYKNDAERIKGTWEGEMDMSESLGIDEEAMIGLTMKFTDDEVTVTFDSKDYKKIMKESLEAMAEEYDSDIEELLGMSVDEYIEENFDEDDLKTTSDYEWDGDALMVDDEETDYEFDGDDKLTIEEDGEKLELKRK